MPSGGWDHGSSVLRTGCAPRSPWAGPDSDAAPKGAVGGERSEHVELVADAVGPLSVTWIPWEQIAFLRLFA